MAPPTLQGLIHLFVHSADVYLTQLCQCCAHRQEGRREVLTLPGSSLFRVRSGLDGRGLLAFTRREVIGRGTGLALLGPEGMREATAEMRRELNTGESFAAPGTV